MYPKSAYLSRDVFDRIYDARSAAQKQSANALKDLLRKNGQKLSGAKDELVERVAHCSVLGGIARCPSCGGGKPDFSLHNQTYFCKGYFDDDTYVRCMRRFNFPDVDRTAWVD